MFLRPFSTDMFFGECVGTPRKGEVMRTMLLSACLVISFLLATPLWAEGCHLGRYGTLPVAIIDGRATTTVKINGSGMRFALDTGAVFNIMSRANASALGLKLRSAPFDFRIEGIGGSANAQFTQVEQFGFLDDTFKHVGFIVGGSDAGYGLLGANVLDMADLEIDLAHGKLTLFKANHCDKVSMAYWNKGGNAYVADTEAATNSFDRRTILRVMINGKKLRALLDSGASATMLSRPAAERVGIDLNAANVKSGGTISGFGAKFLKSWIVPINSFSVGTELIQHSQMMVMDGSFGNDGIDMLIGVDFILAHHMFIANSQRKAYFTYNGGRVFTFATALGASDTADGDTATADKPLTASDYALRGQAHSSRGEPKAALADLDEAIRMTPDQADYYAARARAHLVNNQPEAAFADLNKSLSLDPKQLEPLLMRAEFRLVHKDHAGALADVTAASRLAPAGSPSAQDIVSLYVQLDQPAAALPIIDDWIRLHGDDSMLGKALNLRCWVRGLSNQGLDDALRDCRKAIRRDGETSSYLDSLGMVQLRLGHYPESIKAYDRALAKNPHAAWSRYGLGLAKIRSGQTDAGKADLRAAHALDPEIDARATRYGLTATTP